MRIHPSGFIQLIMRHLLFDKIKESENYFYMNFYQLSFIIKHKLISTFLLRDIFHYTVESTLKDVTRISCDVYR